jgi:hypothetical protein
VINLEKAKSSGLGGEHSVLGRDQSSLVG